METAPLLSADQRSQNDELETVGDRNKLLWPWVVATAISTLVGIWYLLHGFDTKNPSGDTEVHLAVSPQCGTLSGPVADINVGIVLQSYGTIVAFGVRELCSSLFEARISPPGFIYRRRPDRRVAVGSPYPQTPEPPRRRPFD